MTAERIEVADIVSTRLDLVWLGPAFIEAALQGRKDDCEVMIGAHLGDDWLMDRAQARMDRRLQQMAADPDSGPWLLRAMVHRIDRQVVGYINFHGQPDDNGRAELGYAVFQSYRRQGYASEAATAMMRWAREVHGVRRFLVSIAPDNEPSLALAGHLGFRQIGEQMDEEDGLEYVFELEVP